jgi:hypothetical protein
MGRVGQGNLFRSQLQEPTERTRRCAIYCASQTRHISTLGLAAEQTSQVLLGTLPRDLASKKWCEALPKRRYEVGRHMLCLGHLFHPFVLTRSVPAVRRCTQRLGHPSRVKTGPPCPEGRITVR